MEVNFDLDVDELASKTLAKRPKMLANETLAKRPETSQTGIQQPGRKLASQTGIPVFSEKHSTRTVSKLPVFKLLSEFFP